MKDRLKLFSIGLGVVTLIIVIAGAFLIMGRSNDAKQGAADVESGRNDVQRFYSKNPFPSESNAEIETQNARMIESVGYRGLNDLLRQNEVLPLKMTPGQFKDYLAAVRKSLLRYAREHEVKVNPDFHFGFGEYTGTDIPDPQDVPRLSQQLQIMSNICVTLFSAGISELESVEREKFEAREDGAKAATVAAGGALVNPGAGKLRPGQLFAPWRFRVSFNAKESGILTSMNLLSRHECFVKVNSVSLRSLSMGVAPPKHPYEGSPDDKTTDPAKRKPLSPNQRMVSGGIDPVLPVRMELSVYRFAETRTE